jgi:hypothetical protein
MSPSRQWESRPGCERRRDYRDVFDADARWGSDEDFEAGTDEGEDG